MDKIVQLPSRAQPARAVRSLRIDSQRMATMRTRTGGFLIHSDRGFLISMPFNTMGRHLGAPTNEA